MGVSDSINLAMSSLADSEISVLIRESTWIFPTLETIHVAAVALVFFGIAMMDARILGFLDRSRAAGVVVRDTVPLVWSSFIGALVTGAGMFLSSPVEYAANSAFLLKLGLLGLAGLNMLLFHWHTRGELGSEHTDFRRKTRASAGAVASLTLWLGIVFAGRWIGFLL